jgi:hypothetical protein
MAILVSSGRAALAAALMDSPFYLAWGSGDPDWDDTPIEPSINTTSLLNETGRHIATTVGFCDSDPDGEIVVPNGRFTQSVTPTNHLHITVNFDFTDGVGLVIREIGLFSGGTTDPDLPPGQLYFEPADVVTPGMLTLLEYVPKITRTGSVRQSFDFVLTV